MNNIGSSRKPTILWVKVDDHTNADDPVPKRKILTYFFWESESNISTDDPDNFSIRV